MVIGAVVLFPGGIILEVRDGPSESVPVEPVRVSIVVAAKATPSVLFATVCVCVVVAASSGV